MKRDGFTLTRRRRQHQTQPSELGRHDVGRRTRPGWSAGPPPVAVLAPGDRGTWSAAARRRQRQRRAVVAATASAQLPRRRRPSATAEDQRTKVGRQVLVVVRIVQSDGGGGTSRPETGGVHHGRGHQRRIHEPVAHLAIQAAKVYALCCGARSSRRLPFSFPPTPLIESRSTNYNSGPLTFVKHRPQQKIFRNRRPPTNFLSNLLQIIEIDNKTYTFLIIFVKLYFSS